MSAAGAALWRLLHRRWRRRVSLLASGALAPGEDALTRAHLESCPSCRREHGELREVLELLARDPVHGAVPGLALSHLVARVDARIEAERGARTAGVRRWLALPAAAAAGVLVWVLADRPAAPPAASPESPGAAVSEEMLRRMERVLAREQTVRYLNDAQAVLVTVASQARDCDEESGTVDVADEADRSRDLLRRRSLLAELDASEVASAAPVLEDVEQMLREVAALEACARSQDLEAIHREIGRRRLLMKIDLMARELQG
jgi:hypothetical protein